VYLHNLTAILADQGSLAKPGQLNYSIPEQPATVHEILLQKSDGTFELVVWNERLKGADEVTVHLGGMYPEVKVCDPTIGTEPIQTHRGLNSLKLTLSDHPLIIAIAQKSGRKSTNIATIGGLSIVLLLLRIDQVGRPFDGWCGHIFDRGFRQRNLPSFTNP
jgi:hypothetical protein